ncbi:4-amino-4-deoxy-L-arabinose transferase [Promicromonospora umidemergens]|uniref:Glycosyl transferase n=1 Tax=Promicromonospora umidemergens TaxID=629679 RepID=A0ABP8XKZ5_9MICO|nr:glycosyltransferase family 39 protein [Promicromonospora umidemergens]MCP2285687.1 4-amino-4-deoxy-L-arabinose transferase [Promicromonospora umidemergens]
MTAVTKIRAPVASIGAGLKRSRSRAAAWALARRRSLLWLSPVVVLGAIVSFVNVGGAPQRIDDEGTYTAQAWAVTNFGELAHYTYWYDHPPLGWLQIAGYTELTGAFARWDIAVLAGREAVLVASVIAVVLLWVLARRVGLSRPAASAAGLIFMLSPLALQFHRTVYLDNIAVPWLLLAFVLAMNRNGQLAAFAGSAAAFGVAVLTKETFLLALPVLVWVMVRASHRETRRYTLSVSASILVLIGGSYLLLAAVKGELLSGPGHVSLTDGIVFQLGSRASSGSLTDPGSLINRTLGMWWQLDQVFIILAIAAAVVALFLRRLRPYGALLLGLTVFMLRPGGYVPVPYVVALLPFGALLIAGVVNDAVVRRRRKEAPRRRLAMATVAIAAVGALTAAPLWTTQLRGFLLADLDRPMRSAQEWLTQNVSRDQRLIVDDAMWVDLVQAGWDRENVVWYYKLDTDPEVQAQSPNGWRDSDYVITTDSMRTFPGAFPQVREATENSVVVASFGEGTQAVEIRRVAVAGADAASEAQGVAADERKTLGTQLAVNPDVQLTADDRDRLVAGQIDTPIVALLGALAGSGGVVVSGFPVIEGEDSRPVRQVAISQLDGEPSVVDGEPSADIRDLVTSLDGSYAPADVRVDGDNVVLRYPVSLQGTLP